jgi:hypothetical protein
MLPALRVQREYSAYDTRCRAGNFVISCTNCGVEVIWPVPVSARAISWLAATMEVVAVNASERPASGTLASGAERFAGLSSLADSCDGAYAPREET